MEPEPNELRDVIVHFVAEVDPARGTRRDRWMVYLGLDKRTETDDEAIAVFAGRKLAVDSGRPAWLLGRGGYPLKPIDVSDTKT